VVIGSLGEAVDASALCRVSMNALRSAASSAHSDATANEGHVNYDVSDVSVKAYDEKWLRHSWVLRARRCKK
jgi:hypothetical protein